MRIAAPGVHVPGVQAIQKSSSNVVRGIRISQHNWVNLKYMRRRELARVQRSGCCGACQADVCHAAVVTSQQNVKIGKHHALVD